MSEVHATIMLQDPSPASHHKRCQLCSLEHTTNMDIPVTGAEILGIDSNSQRNILEMINKA